MTKIYLTEAQKWEVAKFVIENKGVTFKESGIYEFRAFKEKLVKEVSEKLFKITVAHLKSSMDFYMGVCTFTNNLPKIPEPESTVEVDMLKAKIAGLENSVDVLTQKLTLNEEAGKKKVIEVYNLQERLKQIGKLCVTPRSV